MKSHGEAVWCQRIVRRVVCALILVAGGVPVRAYNLQTSPVWAAGDVVGMNIQLGEVSGGPLWDGSPTWNEPVEAAIAAWNQYIGRTRLKGLRGGAAAVDKANGANTVVFSDSVYGDAWQGRTIGYCAYWWRGGKRIEADVFFKSTTSWNSYRGPQQGITYDLQRFALHELGHAIGLDHPDDIGQHADAIMNSVGSDLDSLQTDDIAGARAIYSTAAVVILAQPVSVEVREGENAAFTVTADGNPAPTFQWQKNVEAIVGATSATLTLTAVKASDAGNYTVLVTNSSGSALTSAATLTILTAPSFANESSSQTATVGASVTFAVTVAGSPTPALRWQTSHDGGASWSDLTDGLNPSGSFSGVTKTSLVIANAGLALSGDWFRCAATNKAGTARSTPVTLTVSKAVARVLLDGLVQRYAGTPLPASASTVPAGLRVVLTYDGVTTMPTDAGDYAVSAIVDDAVYAGTGSGTLAITKAPLIARANDLSKLQGTANPPLTVGYSGWVNGESESVLDSAPTATTTATTQSPAGIYPIALSGGSDKNYALTLVNGTLTVTTSSVAPAITSMASATFQAGQAGSFTVLATGVPAPTFGASGLPAWASLNSATGVVTGTPSSAEGSPFTINLTASNGIAPDATQTFTLTVQQTTSAPVFSSQPSDRSIKVNGGTSFTASASGAPSPSYRWQLSTNGGGSWANMVDGGSYAGTSSTTLSLSGATLAMDGYRYRCVASNSAGTANSNSAMLTVTDLKTAGTYFGMFPNNHGRWALKVKADNTAVYIAYLTSRNSAIVAHLTIDPDGSFTVTGTETVSSGASGVARTLSLDGGTRENPRGVASSFTLTGQISSGTVSGQLTGLSETFTGAIDSAAGSAASGYYEASALNTASGATYAIVAPSGQTVVVTVTATGVDGATGTVAGSGQLTATTAGGGQLVLTISGSTQSVAATLTLTGSTTPISFAGLADTVRSTARLVNIAARAYCSTDNKVTIGGFVVSGRVSKRVLVRAVGPSLTAQGIGAGEVLLDPTIEVHDAIHGNSVIATNDNWGDNPNAAEINTAASAVGATALLGSDTKSAMLLLDLAPGVYSFVVNGQGATSGIVLLEIYDADATATGATFANIATRAQATTGNGVTIGGFVISGNAPKHVLLRAVGSTLATQGLGVTEVLTDPTIELHDALHGNAIIATNDNWGDNANAASITATGARIGATPFDQSDTKSSALLVTLQPGVYSFIASGKSNTSGIVLVEVYDAD